MSPAILELQDAKPSAMVSTTYTGRRAMSDPVRLLLDRIMYYSAHADLRTPRQWTHRFTDHLHYRLDQLAQGTRGTKLVMTDNLKTPAERAWEARVRRESSAQESISDIGGSRGRSPINMAERLQNFRTRSESPDDPEIIHKRNRQRQNHEVVKSRRRKVLDFFEAKASIEAAGPWEHLLRFLVPWRTGPRMPDQDELVQVAQDTFTPRHDLTVYVCDFFDDHSETFEVALSDIEACWRTKPAEVTVRWIHAPLGRGIVHSSIEDRFRHDVHHGRPFTHAAYAGWLYPEIDMLYLESRGRLQDMRDVHEFISTNIAVTKSLDGVHFPMHLTANPITKNLHIDMSWRTNLLKVNDDFWSLAETDHPLLLSEGISLTTESAVPMINRKRKLDPSALAIHPEFEGIQLVRAPFRCFHRQDGCLLSMSPAKRVNYINRDIKEYLEHSGEAILENRDASVIAQLMKNFERTGTKNWHKKTVEWFMVYLLTEVGATPHTDLHGRSATAILSGLQSVVQELKARRYDRWRRNTTVDLVSTFLNTADELATLKDTFKNMAAFFKRLGQDVIKQDQEDSANQVSVNNPKGDTAIGRIRWAASMVTRQADETDRLLSDLMQAMNTLFQLRSIEQNELAITADSQNKAILLFTGVTIVFLPLSFFTSYYGMNLNGVIDTKHSEGYFWKLCGSIALAIVLLVALFAFRQQFVSRVLMRRQPQRPTYSVV
ncbi:MAG: hypothetical protein M1828_000867 [Chrysothrix sp. TS-e1954]|nr:MAG: hypothetical protein M1828_000867 [Chrysothrix sp. TS-e1954]